MNSSKKMLWWNVFYTYKVAVGGISIAIAQNLIKLGLTNEQIAYGTELSIEEIETLGNQILYYIILKNHDQMVVIFF